MGVKVPLRLIDVERFIVRFFGVFLLISILIISVGCDENNNTSGGDAGDPLQADIDTTPPDFLADPVFTMAPNPNAPISGLLELQTNEPTRVTITITEDSAANNAVSRATFETTTIEFDDFLTEHSLPVLGFTSDGTFSIEIAITDESLNQRVFDQPIITSTDPLPEGFPLIEVTSSPENMEPGVTIFPLRARAGNIGFGSFLVAVNNVGDVIWYRIFDDIAYGDVTRISNGNLLLVNSNTSIIEVNMLGDIVRQWHTFRHENPGPESILVETEVFHHEVFEMPNGNLLTLGVEVVIIDDFPSSETDPFAPTESAFVAGDTVIEFSKEGLIVNEWSLLQMLDPLRIGYGSLLGFWNSMFSELEQGTRDWSHGNAVIYDQSDDSVITSLRHQDAVIKFSRSTGELTWILGNHDNWNLDIYGDFLFNPLEPDFLWQYHQHAPMIMPNGNILIYDNGNLKASPFEETVAATENFSRAIEFSIDTENMEIQEVWEYGEFTEEILYAPFIGDVDYLPVAGNVLITHGGIAKDLEGNPTDSIGTAKITPRIIEVTHTTPAERVFDLSINDGIIGSQNGWAIYRSQRLPSLYPQGQTE